VNSGSDSLLLFLSSNGCGNTAVEFNK